MLQRNVVNIIVITSVPMRGTNSDVGGMFSATSSMKTEYDNSTVMPNVTFSPASGGKQNASKLSRFRDRQGSMMLST